MSLRRVSFALAALVITALAAAPAARAADWQVDPVHSSVIFKILHMNTAPFYGAFKDVQGNISFDPANPTAAKFEITVKADSVDTRNEKRDQHLKGPDFFDVGTYPTIKFVSTKVEGDAKKLTVTGDLTLHGVTKPVTATISLTGTGKGQGGVPIAGFDVQFSVKRSEFGMNYMPPALGDEINLMIGLEVRQK
jgi:polyisoprenoid-binding protein YceI